MKLWAIEGLRSLRIIKFTMCVFNLANRLKWGLTPCLQGIVAGKLFVKTWEVNDIPALINANLDTSPEHTTKEISAYSSTLVKSVLGLEWLMLILTKPAILGIRGWETDDITDSSPRFSMFEVFLGSSLSTKMAIPPLFF